MTAAVPDPADVEKAARAIYDANNALRHISWDDVHEAVREHMRRLAVAALAAVRPSPDSEAAARDADRQRLGVTCDCLGPPYYVCAHWPDRAALGTGDREGGR